MTTSPGIEAVARAFGSFTSSARSEFDLIEAKTAALISDGQAKLLAIELRCAERIAETEARCAALEGALEARIAERLADVRDGADADVAPLEARVEAAIAAIPPVPSLEEVVAAIPAPRDGLDGSTPDIAPLIAAVDAAIAAIPVVRDGKDVNPEEVEQLVARAVAALPPPKDGRDADADAIGRKVMASLPPHDELRGEPGPPGALPVAEPWVDGVTYEGQVRTYVGATWQATRDTGRAPNEGQDWRLLAERGKDGIDGRSLRVRGTWDAGAAYEKHDVAMVGGSSFIAKTDQPGPCPGDDWQLLASRGKTGEPGRPGIGSKGDPGPPGPGPLALTLEADTVLTLTLADGMQLTCDLYDILARLQR